MQSNLCLGTAQFGMNYGVTNKSGKISKKEVGLIIKKALEEDICYFDTANAYGNSESRIGELIKNQNAKIITKFATNVNGPFKSEDIEILELQFKNSLSNLNKSQIDAYLLHDPKDLKKENNFLLINWLKSLKDRELVKRIGISIYEESDLQGIDYKEIEIIQMPISIYDQRLLHSELLKKLLDKNISIHLRSIFLQGLLIQKATKWPKFLSRSFIDHHFLYEKEVNDQKLSLLDSAISFIKKLNFPELVLFGVTQLSELDSILDSWKSKRVLENKINYNNYQWNNIYDIDPRNWESKNN